VSRYELLSFSLPVRIELREQGHVIVHFLKRGIEKLERIAAAFLHEPIIDRICFPELTGRILFIVAMFAIGIISDKDLFDMGRRIFNVSPMPVNVTEEETKHNAVIPDVYSGKDLFAFHP